MSADRELIAQMLAALKLLMIEIEQSGLSTAKEYGWPAAVEAARAAIAKAEPSP